MDVLELASCLILLYFLFNTFYISFFSLIGAFSKNKATIENPYKNTFLILFPSYKNDQIILNGLEQFEKIKYPKNQFDVYIIGDHLQNSTYEIFDQKGINFIRLEQVKSTKTKAIQEALKQINIDKYDYIIINDIDNIMEPNFLNEINNTCITSPDIVQGHRIAKNTNNGYAILDAISEEINNTIFRKAHVKIGLSSALIGSGFATKASLFKDTINSCEAVGGFDKELEVKFLSNNHHILYAHNAFIFDEKTDNPQNFEKQRLRWISAQIFYFRKHIFKSIIAVFKGGNLDYFEKIIQFALLPRVIMLGLSILIIPISALFFPQPFSTLLWTLHLILLFTSLALATPTKYRNSETLKSLLLIPLILLRISKIAVKLKGSNQEFVHTEHKNHN